jgi:hypothetical protein
MKVELDNVTLGYSELSGTVFAGTTIKPGVWRHKVNVTQAFIGCVIQKWGSKQGIISDGENEWEITVKKIK